MDLCNVKQIRELLRKHGFSFSKSMGQNFLTESWVPERIAEEADIDSDTGVLEVGPGIGTLTMELAKRANKVVCIELDNSLKSVLAETLAEWENIELVFGDSLKMDLADLSSKKLSGLKPVVCANIPYNITSPLISAFLEADCFESMTLMVQREVADRICARANTKDYGAFSIYVNWHASSEKLFDVSPECFLPQPKVWSSVIKLIPRKKPAFELSDEKLFFRIVRAAFAQRRKTLVNALSSGLGIYSKEKIKETVTSCGFSELIRGEALDIEDFVKLTNAFSQIVGQLDEK